MNPKLQPHTPVSGAGESNNLRLDSWKEIAAYLGRSERTVCRWEEREGLPVHRLQHEKRGSVFAYKRELDAWWNARRKLVEPEPQEAVVTPRSNNPAANASQGR